MSDNGNYRDAFQQTLKCSVNLTSHTHQCIMVIISQSCFLTIHHLCFKTRRNTEVSINTFPLHICPGLHFISIMPSDAESRNSLGHTNYLTRSGCIITIHNTHRQILHLSVTKNCSHKEDRKQRQDDTRCKINAPGNHTVQFTFQYRYKRRFFHSSSSFIFTIHCNQNNIAILLSFQFIQIYQDGHTRS